VFYLVPVIGICFNIFPVNNSFYFALAFTLYIVMIQVRSMSCRFRTATCSVHSSAAGIYAHSKLLLHAVIA
jgi:hypothetical protein